MPKSKNNPKPVIPQPMPVGKFTITINKFRALGGVFPISATMAPDVKNPPCITIAGDKISVKGQIPVKLIFELPNPAPDPGYVLLGVAFASNTTSVTVGLHTFPTVTINRQPTGSEMIVADHPQDVGTQHYDYVILVQSVETGDIGIIDPALENEAEGS